jgi:WhiB family redox-sensing transcriptional regulator
MALQAGQALRGSRVQSSPNHWLAGRRVDRDRVVGTKTFGEPLAFLRHPDDGRPRTDLPCLETDPETFFPVGACRQVGGSDELAAKVELAKSFCARCPVTDGCLAWALDHDPDGVWGGTTEAERAELTGRWPRNSTRPARQGVIT